MSSSADDKSRVLMEMYGLIREEVMMNIKRYDTVLSLMPSLALALLVTIRQAHAKMAFPWVPFLFLGIAAMYVQSHLNITYLSKYLVLLEKKINKETGVGLDWEQRWVGLGLFYNRAAGINAAIPLAIIAAIFVASVYLGLNEAFRYAAWLGGLLVCFYVLLMLAITICLLIGRRSYDKLSTEHGVEAEFDERLTKLRSKNKKPWLWKSDEMETE